MALKDSELVTFFLDEASDLLSEWERVCLGLEAEQSAESFNALFRIAHNIKGSSRAVGLLEVGDFIHKVEDTIVSVRDGKLPFSSLLLEMFLEAQSNLSAWFTILRDDPEFVFSSEEFFQKYFSEKHATPAPAHFTSEEAKGPVTLAVVGTDKEPPAPSASARQPSQKDEVLRVSAKKIDNLLNLIGELSIQQSILENAMVSTQRDQDTLTLSSLNLSRKITKEIYNTAFGLRMTPIGGIYQRLERAIKDLARDLGKDIEVELLGSDVEIEKTILDKLIDPLTHIVRNSVDHGIESASQRIAAGKGARGKVTILAQKEGDGVEITIKDDGKGLNRQRILEKALEKGIIKSAQGLHQDEIFGLIFLPGFSTAEKVTNVSGRGVGMDVVMRTIEEVEGKILLASEEGRGTKFRIMIPTSLSIVESLIVAVNGANYVLPISSLEEVLDVKPEELRRDRTVYSYRGQVIPYLHLTDVLGGETPSDRLTIPLLVTKFQGKRIALGVDSILGQHQSVVRSLNSYFDQSFAVSGGTILPSGEPGLILNVNSIIERFFKYLNKTTEAAA